MCMGGSSDSSDKMIKMQKEEAEAARQKEAERQARLAQGLDAIRMAFEGSPIMGSRQVATPAGTQTVTTPGTTRQEKYNDPRTGVNKVRTVQIPGSSQQVATPAGVTNESYDTGGRTGGFDESFYDNFKQGILDYYMPQVAEQYGEAKDETTFGLARHGLGRSSVATDKMADLSKQNEIQEGNVRTKADTGAADLRSRVASERAKAESQLYATENPEVAANQATAAVTNLNAEQPDLSPLAEVFKIAALGGAGLGSGYRNAEYMKRYGLSNTSGWGATSVVPS